MAITELSVRRTTGDALRPVTSAVAAAAVALALAACGAGSSAAPGAPSAQAFTAAAYRFSACMRDHGLPTFPDPSLTDHDGQQVAYLAPTDAMVASPAYKTANRACQATLPIATSARNTESQFEREQHILGFARCMRDHEIPKFPDPTAQGQLTLKMLATAGVDLHAPAVISAAKSCLPSADGAITAQEVQRALNGEQ